MFSIAIEMTPRYIKKISEFSQLGKSAENYFLKSTSHSSTEIGGVGCELKFGLLTKRRLVAGNAEELSC
jgi:hypothetical protein